jgi:hypothetical protein
MCGWTPESASGRHPEAPRLHQRGEGSGAELTHPPRVHRRVVTHVHSSQTGEVLRATKVLMSTARDPSLRLKNGYGRDDAFQEGV